MFDDQGDYGSNKNKHDDDIPRFYGKYRGQVKENNDPYNLGRIRAIIPHVLHDQVSGWATPCIPYAGKNVGFYFIPPIDANVWIEFEDGHQNHPIWTGCFWGPNELDKDNADPTKKMIKTDFATITINDNILSGEVKIETKNGLNIVMDTSGIELSNGPSTIKLSPISVSINEEALQVNSLL